MALPWPSVIDTVGVYVIWHEGNLSRVGRVGHGEIRERLHYHQEDPEVLAYSRFGTLRVTWAAVQSDQMEGVERYLVEHWKPLVEDRPPKVVPIAVNSPFGGLGGSRAASCIGTTPTEARPPRQACRRPN